jgi:hypothetical protein
MNSTFFMITLVLVLAQVGANPVQLLIVTNTQETNIESTNNRDTLIQSWSCFPLIVNTGLDRPPLNCQLLGEHTTHYPLEMTHTRVSISGRLLMNW